MKELILTSSLADALEVSERTIRNDMAKPLSGRKKVKVRQQIVRAISKILLVNLSRPDTKKITRIVLDVARKTWSDFKVGKIDDKRAAQIAKGLTNFIRLLVDATFKIAERAFPKYKFLISKARLLLRQMLKANGEAFAALLKHPVKAFFNAGPAVIRKVKATYARVKQYGLNLYRRVKEIVSRIWRPRFLLGWT